MRRISEKRKWENVVTEEMRYERGKISEKWKGVRKVGTEREEKSEKKHRKKS